MYVKKIDQVEMLDLKGQGWSVTQLSARYGCSKAACSKMLKVLESRPPSIDMPTDEKVITCLHCKKQFTRRHLDRKFCSKECMYEHKRELGKRVREATCPVCGKDFIRTQNQTFCSIECVFLGRRSKKPMPSSSHPCRNCGSTILYKSQKYCSVKCKTEYEENERLKRAKKRLKTTICPQCGKEFVNPTSKRYCSSECIYAVSRKQKTIFELTCEQCGKTFERMLRKMKPGYKFCSNACSQKWNKINLGNKDNKRPGLPPRIRFGVFERDQFRCVYCGNGPKDGIRLEIDHLIPVSRGGSNIESNLVTACSECNAGKSDRKVIIKRQSSRKVIEDIEQIPLFLQTIH